MASTVGLIQKQYVINTAEAHWFNLYFVDAAEYTCNIHRGAKIHVILPSNESEHLMTQKIQKVIL